MLPITFSKSPSCEGLIRRVTSTVTAELFVVVLISKNVVTQQNASILSRDLGNELKYYRLLEQEWLQSRRPS